MKKVLIFHLTYQGNKNHGSRTHRITCSIFTRKSAIVNEFFDWIKKESINIKEELGESCVITNVKIIGL
jgi:NTP pyrophosphatase (non-canonical NTP hydrolase)